jgi:hypothetical protein
MRRNPRTERIIRRKDEFAIECGTHLEFDPKDIKTA